MRVSWGWVAAVVLAALLVLTWRGCGIEPIDRVKAAELEAVTARADSIEQAARARFDSLAAAVDSAALAFEAREDSLRDAASRAAAASNASRSRAVAQAENLREALEAARMCPPWCAVLDSVTGGYEAALEAKDDEVAAERSLAEGFREQNERMAEALAAARDALAASDSTRLGLTAERDFWRAEAERLEAVPRFHVNAPGVLVPVALGLGLLGGLALGG